MKTPTPILLSLIVVFLTLPLTQPSQQSTRQPTTIPVEITSFGGIVLQARVNNSPPLSFYLDSGATFPFIINANKTTSLGLKVLGNVSHGGGAGPNTYEASQTNGLTIGLEQLTFADQPAKVIDLRVVEEQFGRPVDGIVGIDLFLKYVVEINYAGNQLRLYDPKSYVYSGTGESVPLTLRDRHLFVPAKIDIQARGELGGQFLIDTGGCMMTTILTAPFAQKNNLPVPTQKTILDESISGLGGKTSLLVGRASKFTIGSSVFASPLIYISQDKGGALASSEFEGLIGTEILQRFKVIFDYSRRSLILERNRNFAEPLEYDMSGMSFRAYGDDFRTFKIYQVLEDSPAGKAGFRVGDIIDSINTIPASKLSLEQILQMMKLPNREYQLTIKRGSERRVLTIKTKRLI